VKNFTLRELVKNTISMIGLGLALVCTTIGLPLMAIDFFSSTDNPYTTILIYVMMPSLSALGLAMAVFGMWLEKRRRERRPDHPVWEFPRIDLNEPRQRLILVGSVSAGLVILVLLTVTGYRTYEFTDSVTFCGEVCHEVMKPEFVAYQNSPHARVGCVECHVGPGAGWYVRSKLSGAYQLYSVAFDKFSRPIETPVENLRPAQHTCEQCHWPAKFFGAQQKTFTHFLADEKNSPWQVVTLLKIGGGDTTMTTGGGIHWHMNIANDIYYIAADKKRESIPWVKAVSKTGKVTEYMSTESPLTPEEIARASIRKMDCVDCHNRPSHIYNPPDSALNVAFETGKLDPSLPYLKREGMRLLAGEYKTEAEARQAILTQLPAFYKDNYPSLYKEKGVAIRQATEVIQTLFSTNIFPEMKTDWRVHPNHISHLNSDGCFRCHDGLHKSADGKVITNDCGACHTFLAQGSPAKVAATRLQAQPFIHPVDVGVDVKDMKCSACHTGTIGL